VVARDFGGKVVREQNLSEWRQGGYRDWQRRRELCEVARQLQAAAGDLAGVTDNAAFNRALSLVLKADLAQTARQVMEEITDPAKRAECLGSLAGKFAQLRREESNAAKVEMLVDERDRELAEAERWKKSDGRLAPVQALLMQREYLNLFSQPDVVALLGEAGPEKIFSPAIRPGD